jgi:Domain of unknown function (DUF6391)
MAAFNAFVLPWLVILLVLLNLPYLTGVARGLLLSEPEKWNHALEHGTIHFLEVMYGASTSVGGRALKHGFRVSGARGPDDIRRAFRDLLSLPKEQRWGVVLTKECGSMIVFSQGVGILLLLVTVVFFVLMPPSWPTLVTALGAQLLLFLALRRPLGLFIQRRHLLSLGFSAARIRHITRVEANPSLETAPVYLVETLVH